MLRIIKLQITNSKLKAMCSAHSLFLFVYPLRGLKHLCFFSSFWGLQPHTPLRGPCPISPSFLQRKEGGKKRRPDACALSVLFRALANSPLFYLGSDSARAYSFIRPGSGKGGIKEMSALCALLHFLRALRALRVLRG